jgi:hypothetical protein
MNEHIIFITYLIVSFLQVIHIFEEIALDAFTMNPGKNPRGIYLRVASVLVLINFFIILLLYLEIGFAYYLAFYGVFISAGNMAAHIFLWIKKKKRLGMGFPSSVPLGIAGLFLLYMLINAII